MNRLILLSVLIVLVVLGIIDSLYLLYLHFTGENVCLLTNTCADVLNSRYSEFFSLPLAFYGTLYYLTMLTLLLREKLRKNTSFFSLFAISSLGVLISIVLLFIQGVMLKKWCGFCLVSAGVSILIFGVLVWIYLIEVKQGNEAFIKENKKIKNLRNSLLICFVCVLISFVLYVGLDKFVVPKLSPLKQQRIVATINGVSYTEQKLNFNKINRLDSESAYDFELRKYRLKLKWFETVLLEEEAKKRNISLDELLKKELIEPSKVLQGEIDANFDYQKKIRPEIEWPALKIKILKELPKYKEKVVKEKFLKKLKKSNNADFFEFEPVNEENLTQGDSFYSWGRLDAPVKIYVFSDFECGHCRDAHFEMEKWKKLFPNDIRISYRHYPLTQHKNSFYVAQVATCLDESNFFIFASKIYKDQSKISRQFVDEILTEMKVDKDKVLSCTNGYESKRKIDFEKEVGQKINITSTPTFVINNKRYKGLPSIEFIKKEIEIYR